MSIHYRFTEHGTIFVWCGDDWIEIQLPGGDGGGDVVAGPSPHAPDLTDPSTGAKPNAVPGAKPKIGGEPPVPPGTMFIGMSGGRGRVPKLLLGTPAPDVDAGAAAEAEPPRWRPSSLADLQAQIERSLRQQSFFRRGGVQLVELDVSRFAGRKTLTLVDIEAMLQDWGPQLGAPGIGVREDDE